MTVQHLAATPKDSLPQEDIPTSAQRHGKEIVDNITARSVLHRANATLEGKDGCAGEFFECKLCINSVAWYTKKKNREDNQPSYIAIRMQILTTLLMFNVTHGALRWKRRSKIWRPACSII
jgi:hypothetical protein